MEITERNTTTPGPLGAHQASLCSDNSLYSNKNNNNAKMAARKHKFYTTILCRLRDDVQLHMPLQQSPEDCTLEQLVRKNYEHHFGQLTWEEATVNLLFKITEKHNTFTEKAFAQCALAHMKEITGDSYIWMH